MDANRRKNERRRWSEVLDAVAFGVMVAGLLGQVVVSLAGLAPSSIPPVNLVLLGALARLVAWIVGEGQFAWKRLVSTACIVVAGLTISSLPGPKGCALSQGPKPAGTDVGPAADVPSVQDDALDQGEAFQDEGRQPDGTATPEGALEVMGDQGGA